MNNSYASIRKIYLHAAQIMNKEIVIGNVRVIGNDKNKNCRKSYLPFPIVTGPWPKIFLAPPSLCTPLLSSRES